MKRIAALSFSILFAVAASNAAFAADAGELIGAWNVESFDGQPPDPTVKMTVTFVDEDTMTRGVVLNGEDLGTEEIRYEATDDGTLTLYSDDEPDGVTLRWEIDDAGKLHLIYEEDGESEEMVLGRI